MLRVHQAGRERGVCGVPREPLTPHTLLGGPTDNVCSQQTPPPLLFISRPGGAGHNLAVFTTKRDTSTKARGAALPMRPRVGLVCSWKK